LDLIRINEVVEIFGLSSRTLRYYEEKGLIWSHYPEYKVQRHYDAAALERLKQIVVLRKLQIPIKDIATIFQSESTAVLTQAFVDKLDSLDGEIAALSELRQVVNDFLNQMVTKGIKRISAVPLLYEELEKRLIAAEEKSDTISVEKLSNINRKALRLHDVRIIRLPAVRILISRLKTGELITLDGDKMQNLFAAYGLTPTPGMRDCFYRCELGEWTMIRTIPQGYDNQTPYIDESFAGGLYAVASSFFEDMDDTFILLKGWVSKSENYEIDIARIEMIEEILPWDIAHKTGKYQQDVFIPIKMKEV